MRNIFKKSQSFSVFGAHLVGTLVVFLQDIKVLLYFFSSFMASTSDTAFIPETCYKYAQRTLKRNSSEAFSRYYEVYFSDIEGKAHHLTDIFHSFPKTLDKKIETDLTDFSHRIRIALDAPSLNYPIHIPFHPADNFTID